MNHSLSDYPVTPPTAIKATQARICHLDNFVSNQTIHRTALLYATYLYSGNFNYIRHHGVRSL